MKPTVFVHTNDKQMLGALVSSYSLQKRSATPEAFDVRILRLEDYPHLHRRHGQVYLRRGVPTAWNEHDLQSFTLMRFLVPQIMNYDGRAIVLDPDVFAVGDICDLLARDMHGKAILCRRIELGDGRPSYFASSVMLLDCQQLKHWDWNQAVTRLFAKARDYFDWMNLLDEDPSLIGELEQEWNHFDTLNEDTRLLHNTARFTQPWKTGLPVDFVKSDNWSKEKWKLRLRRGRAWCRQRLGLPGMCYVPHPDPRQERFFLELLRNAINDKVISRDLVVDQIRQGNVRSDLLERLDDPEAFANPIQGVYPVRRGLSP